MKIEISGNYVKFPFLQKVALLLQITALLLVQTYPIAPLSPSRVSSQTEDEEGSSHARCGCSAERIASRTCCCFMNPRSCHAGSKKATVAKRGRSGKNLWQIYVCPAPCGRPGESYANSLASFKFIRPLFTVVPALHSAVFTSTIRNNHKNITLKPSIPPPEVTVPVLFTAI